MTEWNHEACRFQGVGAGGCEQIFPAVRFPQTAVRVVREVDRRVELTERVARALGDRRQRGKVRHEVLTMVRQRVHALALGYEDLNDHGASPRRSGADRV